MVRPLSLDNAWRDNKGQLNFKVTCGFSNQERRWAVNVWVKTEVVQSGRTAFMYALHARIPLDKYPGAEEKMKLIEGVRNLFTLKLDSLGIKYKERGTRDG